MEVRTPLDECLWQQRRTSRAFAEELGVHETQVSRWRSGLHTPEEPRRCEIAELLNTTVDALWPDLHSERSAA